MDPAIKDALAGHLSHHVHDVAAAYVFGSHARGEARATSDLDIAILLRNSPEQTLAGLRLDFGLELEQEIGRAIDLVILNRAPTDLVHRVLRDGVLVADFDPSARIQFEVKARNEYFDLAIYRDQYRRHPRMSS